MVRLITRFLLTWLVGMIVVSPAWSRLEQDVADAGVVVLRDRLPQVMLWPAVRLLPDEKAELDWREVMTRLAEFKVPRAPESNLGVRRGAVWLTLPLRAVDGDGRWVFDLDHPAFGEIDVYVIGADGSMLAWHRLGAKLPFQARPMQTRTHAVALELPPGRDHRLLIRLRTDGAMIVPLSLSRPGAYQQRESRRLLLNGVMTGLACALLVYSLLNAMRLRSGLFALYALLVLSAIAAFAEASGLGHQFLWSHRQGLTAMIAPLSTLLATMVLGVFVSGTLHTSTLSPRLYRMLLVLAGAAGIALVLGLPGVLNERQAQVMAGLLDPIVPFLVIAVALRRALHGEAVGRYLLWGGGLHAVVTLASIGLAQGWLPGSGWMRDLLLAVSTGGTLVWLRVLGAHVQGLGADAKQQADEVHALSTQAHTDALTGLVNRRGLEAALPAAITRARRDDMLALVMIDLDGFKAVNDRLGHAVGDKLLIEVARRLKQCLRQRDLVARLGGDEFVVLADGLKEEHQARVVCQKLIDAFTDPVIVGNEPCRIGLTIGFCVAPIDGRDGVELLQRADAAMYEGKRAGRNQARRCGAASLALAA